jgi:hypothetical protein
LVAIDVPMLVGSRLATSVMPTLATSLSSDWAIPETFIQPSLGGVMPAQATFTDAGGSSTDEVIKTVGFASRSKIAEISKFAST